jgi:hypothetical protein
MENPSIPIPFALGEPLWTPSNGAVAEWVECPECAGSGVITLTQGNGTAVTIACGCCWRGFDPPTGRVQRTRYGSVPEPFTPQSVEVRGDEVRYSESPPGSSCYSTKDAANLFRTIEECAARCAELDETRRANDERQAVANLASKRSSMAWSAHYWGRKVRDLERDLAAARGRLAECPRKEVVDTRAGAW